jgi:hypothetical protein
MYNQNKALRADLIKPTYLLHKLYESCVVNVIFRQYKSINKIQFSSWVNMLNLCADGHMPES